MESLKMEIKYRLMNFKDIWIENILIKNMIT